MIPDIEYREWAIIRNNQVIRHLSYDDVKNEKIGVFHSITTYQYPIAKDMNLKFELYTDYVIDIDSLSVNQVLIVVEMTKYLFKKLGYDIEPEVHFSGKKGYHVFVWLRKICPNCDFETLDTLFPFTLQTRNFIYFKFISPTYPNLKSFREFFENHVMRFRKSWWNRLTFFRVFRILEKEWIWLWEINEKELESFSKEGFKLYNKLSDEEKERILREVWVSGFDTRIFTDRHRIIRALGSIHPETGNEVKVVKISELLSKFGTENEENHKEAKGN